MGIRNRLAKIAAVSLTGSAVVIGGLGLAETASADGGQAASNRSPAVMTQAGSRSPQGGLPGGQNNASIDSSFVKTNLRAVAARQIGITEEALTRETMQGLSIAQVAARHGAVYADLKTTLVNVEDADLQAATAAGTVSQAQANQLVSQIPHMVEAFLARTSGRGGPNPVTGGPLAARPMGQNLSRAATPNR